jgi:mRNA interferase MazF
MFRRCDLVLLPFPYTDLSAAKRRPVVILTDPDMRGDFLAAQVTSQAGHPGALPLHDADLSAGKFPKPSYVRPEKLFTLNVSLIVQRAGRFSEDAFGRVRAGVCTSIGCGNSP